MIDDVEWLRLSRVGEVLTQGNTDRCFDIADDIEQLQRERDEALAEIKKLKELDDEIREDAIGEIGRAGMCMMLETDAEELRNLRKVFKGGD